MTRTFRRANAGMSLIELLVVIAVIGVIMSIVLPVLPRIRESALRTRCAANLSGVGKGVILYLGDNNEKFPLARYMPPPWLSADTDPPFNVAMKNYIDLRSEAYQCPGDRVVHRRPVEPNSEETCGMSYTYVAGLSGITFEESFFHRIMGLNTSNTPVMYDFDGGTFETDAGEEITVGFFHSKRVFLYVDGHAATIESTGG